MVSAMHFSTARHSMLRITAEKKTGKASLTVEGKLAGPWVTALEQSWSDLRSGAKGETLSVNLCGVSFIDAAGKALLREIYRQGGQLVAEGCLNQAIVREIASEKIGGSEASNRPKRTPIIFYVLF
jgi:ABC-type transporter Mla MlaB component